MDREERARANGIAREVVDYLAGITSEPIPSAPPLPSYEPRPNRQERAIARRTWLKEHVAAQSNRCLYCNTPMLTDPVKAEHWRRPTLDHRHPLSLGGSDTFDNTAAACWGCNQAKGNFTEAEYRAGMITLRRRRGFP